MRDAWVETLRNRAGLWWTPERTRATFGDKRLLLHPSEAPELLRALGLMTAHAKMPPERVRKYRQIQHMLAVLRPALQELAARHSVVHILDAGCGRSYLTLLVAWWFERIAQHPARILGVDRSVEVIETSRERAAVAGLDNLSFRACTLAELASDPPTPLHALLSLHACDTATDDALALAVQAQVDFVAVAPCCQRELSAAWARLNAPEHPLAPLWTSAHLRRTTAATLTDTFRALLLERHGYETSATEFVEAHHTPKNTLIRGMRRQSVDRAAARVRYERLVAATGGEQISLARLVDLD